MLHLIFYNYEMENIEFDAINQERKLEKYPQNPRKIDKIRQLLHAAALSSILLQTGIALAEDKKDHHDDKTHANHHGDKDHTDENDPNKKHHHQDHKHPDRKWEGSASAALFPTEEKKIGTDIHVAHILGDHHKFHFEIIVADLGFSYEQLHLHGNLIGQRPGVDRYEFHFGAGVGVGIPIGSRFELGISQGIGLGFNYYPSQSLGFKDESRKQLLNFSETFEFAPIYKMHVEINFAVTENFFLTTGFAPHVTLTTVFHDIEAKSGKQTKEIHADFPVLFGVGIEL